MRILFIRHGDPDYENDTLTEKGHREAALLAEQAGSLETGECFVSPLGRAQATAAYSMNKLGKTAETLEWLREFPARLDLNQAEELRKIYPNAEKKNGVYIPRIVWDMIPSYWTQHTEYMDQRWRETEVCRNSDTLQVYDRVTSEFDRFLAAHGYVKEGRKYRVEKASSDTVTFFCHFGITCVLLAHIWDLSPFLLWHTMALAPTSVTEIVTEEREEGTAVFRALRMGDVSHLHMGNEPVSFSARFCETYDQKNQRH